MVDEMVKCFIIVIIIIIRHLQFICDYSEPNNKQWRHLFKIGLDEFAHL